MPKACPYKLSEATSVDNNQMHLNFGLSQLKRMKASEIRELFNSFESIAIDYDGVECWSARELSISLGYSQYRNFLPVIAKAKESCSNAGESVLDHFADVRKMVQLGSNAEREIMLNRGIS